MQLQTQFRIKGNPYVGEYLKNHSFWYKQLNRDPNSIFLLEKEVKEFYRLTPQDRIEDLGQKIELLQNFMDLFR